MTNTVGPINTTAAYTAANSGSGLAASRSRLRSVNASALEGLCALPLAALATLGAGLVLVQSAATAAEFVFLRSSLALIMPEQPAALRSVISAGILLGYATLWFMVGHRLAAAQDAKIAGSTAKSGDGVRAFGVLGMLYAVLALLALGGLTWRRSSVLADREAAKARATADTGSGVLGGSASGGVDPAVAAQKAHDSALISDALFVGGVMLMLAAVSVVVGAAFHLLVRAWRVVAAEKVAARAERTARVADTVRHRAHCDLLSRDRMREDRAVLAERYLDALNARFEHARRHARVYLAVRLGDPSMTSHIITDPEPSDSRPTEPGIALPKTAPDFPELDAR